MVESVSWRQPEAGRTRSTRIGARWTEILRLGLLEHGNTAIRVWLHWSGSIDWRIVEEGPGGEMPGIGSWWSDARGAVSAQLSGLWGVRLLARRAGGVAGSAITVESSFVLSGGDQPILLPPAAGSVRQRIVVSTAADTLIQPLPGQRFVAVQVLDGGPSRSLLLVEGSTTDGGTAGLVLVGLPTGSRAGGYYEETLGGPLALRAQIGAVLAEVVQR